MIRHLNSAHFKISGNLKTSPHIDYLTPSTEMAEMSDKIHKCTNYFRFSFFS